MEITVTYTKDVLQDYFRYVFDKTGKKTKICYTISLILITLFSALSIIFFFLNNKLFFISLILLGTSVSFCLVFTLIKVLYPRLSSKKMDSVQGKTVVFGFTANAFTASFPGGRGKKTYLYRNLYGMAVTKNYIYVYRTSAAAYILPRSEEVLELVKDKIKLI